MWSDLPTDIRSASEVLGWNQTNWGITKPTTSVYDKMWDELSAEEQTAATTLCHFDYTWPGERMSRGSFLGGARDQLIGNSARMLSTVIVLVALSINSLIYIFV